MPKQKLRVDRGPTASNLMRNTALAAVVWSLLSGPAMAQINDDDAYTNVECYRALPTPRERILEHMGGVIVYPDQNPVAVCNQANYSCHYQCIACFYDNDYEAGLCVDNAGNRFLK